MPAYSFNANGTDYTVEAKPDLPRVRVDEVE